MKHILKFTKTLTALIIAISLTLFVSIGVSAENDIATETEMEGGEYTEIIPEEIATGGNNIETTPEENNFSGDKVQNIFDDLYVEMQANADKIFSVLAFLGTLVVGIGYKSGLLPLLKDALSKLKSSIDGVKADGELNKALTESKMSEICRVVSNNNSKLQVMEEKLEGYESLQKERESIRIILAGQIDMLYAIFMSSALPQYQKDEIGERIKEMREELASYENQVAE